MKTAIQIFIATLGTSVAVGLSKYFGTKASIVSPYDLLLAIALSVVLITFLKFVLIELPLLFYHTRKFIDPRALYEGLYYEIYHDREEKRVSISCVKYIRGSKSYEYFGNNYWGDGRENPADTWQSEKVFLDPDKRTLNYFFSTDYLGDNEKTTTGYGYLKFNTETGQYFNLSDPELQRHSHCFKKLDSEDYKKYLNDAKPPKKNDWHLLAMKINKDIS